MVEDLWAGEFTSAPPERRIPIPGPYWTAHRFAFMTPMQAATAGVPPGGWTLETEVSLHSYGAVTSWVNILTSPDDVVHLAVWQKNRREDSLSQVVLPVNRQDRGAISEFVDTLQTLTDEDGALTSRSRPVVQRVAGTTRDPLSGRVGFYPTGEDEAWFEIASIDPAGNERTVTLEYRTGDADRLQNAAAALYHC